MNRVLIEVSKAIETGTLDPETCAVILSFIVEKRRIVEAPADENIALAEHIRRALVDLSNASDVHDVLEILEAIKKMAGGQHVPEPD